MSEKANKLKKGDTPKNIDSEICIPVMIGKEQYYITTDRYNFILGQKITSKKNGKTYEGYSRNASFFSSLETLMVYLSTRKLKNMKASTIAELQTNIRKATDEVRGLYAEITEEELG